MPYGRRRKYSRGSRKLTKSRILTNRSSKSQALQIAKLNKRINYIAKVNRPEIRTIYRNVEWEFTNSTLSSNYSTFQLSPWSGTYSGDDQAAGSLSLEGNFCRCKGISVKLISQYSDNWRDTIADASHDPSAGYRIVLLQEKHALPLDQATNPGIELSDVFLTTNSLSSSDLNLTLPLAPGITSTYRVLYAKTFTINRYHPTRQHNIYIPAKKCLNFIKQVSQTTSSATAQGHVWLCVLTGGLHYDTDYSAQIKITACLKIAYTDN